MAMYDEQAFDDLADFTRLSFTFNRETREVYRKGDGPAVLVISEIPGITPRVARFARRVVDAGFTAVMPVMFGTPGRPPSLPYVASSMTRACISREFHALALRKASPVTEWLRALARHEHEQCGGPGVGAVGMCFTGNFALAMAVDDTMLAPVLSQPSLPFPVSASRRSDLHISDSDLDRVKERCRSEDLRVVGLRFTEDPVVPSERFERLRRELGEAFVAVEIDSSDGNPWGFSRSAHSVLTEELVEEDGHPTNDALNLVLDLFREKLGG